MAEVVEGHGGEPVEGHGVEVVRGDAVEFVKGHGTENDFVLLPDPDGTLVLTAEQVRAICDRHRGIGADGVLRVVRTAKSLEPDVEPLADEAEWFMDYRNADGSLSEMCGNGVRVFIRFLLDEGWASGSSIPVATRGGVRRARVEPDSTIAVDMGAPVARRGGLTEVRIGETSWAATALDIPNPHAVVVVDDLAEAGALLAAAEARPGDPYPGVHIPGRLFPDGVNVEFVRIDEPGHLAMRVFERGVGETRSCGTGACAAVVAARDRLGAGAPEQWQVSVPGGVLRVTQRGEPGSARRERPEHAGEAGWFEFSTERDLGGSVELAGPAVLVARGSLDLDALG
ncbi:MAG TPA: diaminopimelate epimerase [Actinomycetes bacterium]|nr:diaminopimelate epimerase [Actinomycetes bacterium]